MKKIFILLIISILSQCTFAQMPTDAIYMPKKSLCVAAIYGNSTWSEYWEGKLKRDNPNIGKNVTQSFSLMAAYGITDRLNVIINAPYMTTKNTAGNLLGQKGFQDFSAFIKYKVLDVKGLSLNAVAGGSVPMSKYVPDFLPMSIGLQCKTATGRLIAAYHHKSGIYLSASGAYTFRSNITLDKDAYQAYGKVYNTNQVQMPNAADAAVRLGYLKNKIQAEAFLTHFTCTSGDNIRRNDMPFPTNNMQMTNAGFYAKYQYKNIGVMAQVAQTLNGLNVGKNLMMMGGITYQIETSSKSSPKGKTF
jgi:hypothetical protein